MRSSSEKKLIILTVIVVVIIISIAAFIAYAFLSNGNNSSENNMNFQLYNESNSKPTVNTENNIGQNTVVPVENANNEQTQTQGSSTTDTNTYYYKQLSNTAKKIYDGLKKHKDDMKTGTYVIDFGTEFNSILNGADGEEILNQEYQSAWNAFSYDNVDLYYLDINKVSMVMEARTEGATTTYYVKIGPGDYSSYLSSTFANKKEIEDADAYIKDIRNQVMSILGPYNNAMKIRVVNEWMIDNLSYENIEGNNNKYNLYGAIVETKVVCEGYARMFKYIMDGLNIPCILVSGTATNSEGETELHAWNYVELNGQWYAVDVTWNDPVVIGEGELTESQKSKYLLKGKSFLDNHKEDGMISENSMKFIYPKLNSADYIF